MNNRPFSLPHAVTTRKAKAATGQLVDLEVINFKTKTLTWSYRRDVFNTDLDGKYRDTTFTNPNRLLYTAEVETHSQVFYLVKDPDDKEFKVVLDSEMAVHLNNRYEVTINSEDRKLKSLDFKDISYSIGEMMR